MAEMLGRKVVISVAGSPVATARTVSMTINNEAVNITSAGDDGVRRLMGDAGEKSVEITLDGLYTGASLMDLALSSSLIEDVELDYGTYTVEGDFFISSYNEGQPYNEAITFSATLMSSGAVVKGASGS
jgi:predicted secreted protein